ncbi:MAG: phosphatase domain-containing protein [Saprospiraceae bacterium]|nr:DUF2183 domain-containing protein [Lewinella sp.]
MSWKHRISDWLRPFDLLYDRLKRHWKTIKSSKRLSPIQLMAYRGYCSSEKLWLKGRVLEDQLIVARREDSVWRNVVNTYKRFNSREIWGAKVDIRVGEQSFLLQSDREGYFELDIATPKSFLQPANAWLHPIIDLIRTPWTTVDQQSEGEVLFPIQPKFGVITDIDDTIIHTGVASRLMWRAIYRTILKNAGSRVSIKEASAFFRALSKDQTTDQFFNPVFYVSNSPWNLYDLIDDFLRFNQLPKGPILLRDLGLPTDPRPSGYKGHKFETISRILHTYPDLKFVLIGDSGEKDTDIYLDVTQQFPGRIIAIYIRDVQHQGRTARVRNLIENSGRAEVKLLTHFGEAVPHAEALGLLKTRVYNDYFGQARG